MESKYYSDLIHTIGHLQKIMGQATGLIPVIPTLWKAKVGELLRSGVQDQPGQHDETLSLLKTAITINIKFSHVWWCTRVIPATWEAEAGESLEPRRWRLR